MWFLFHMSHACFGEDALPCGSFYLETFWFIELEHGEWWRDSLITNLSIVYRCWPWIANLSII